MFEVLPDDEKDFEINNIKKNYEHMLVKLIAGVNKELEVNKQPWLKRFASALMRLLGFTPKEKC